MLSGASSNATLSEPSLDTLNLGIGFTYDSAGRLSTVQPGSDGLLITNSYGTYGHPTGLGITPYGGSATTIASWTQWDAYGHPVQVQAGSGSGQVVTTRTYDAGTGWLTGIRAGTSNTIENYTYSYDPLGNVTARSDLNQSPTLTESFTYDALNRLCTSALSPTPAPLVATSSQACLAQANAFTAAQTLSNGTVVTNKATTYDTIGNILTKSDVGTYSYTKPHQIASIALNSGASLNGGTASSIPFAYDNNGNIATGPNRTITYTSYNLPATLTSNGKTATWLYDDQHRRFQRVDATGTTRYIWDGGPPMEWFWASSGTQTLKHYLSFQGNTAGEFTATLSGSSWASQTDQILFFQTDGLGSTVATSVGTAVQETDRYDSWGKRRYPTGADDAANALTNQAPNDRHFTGQEFLADSGLVHLNGRLYDPMIGRMMSVDPVTHPYRPQNLNPYAYVENSPLGRTDPSGFDWFNSLFSSLGFGDASPGDQGDSSGDDAGGGTPPAPDGSSLPETVVPGQKPNPFANNVGPSGLNNIFGFQSQITIAFAIDRKTGNIIGIIPSHTNVAVRSVAGNVLKAGQSLVVNGTPYSITSVTDNLAIAGTSGGFDSVSQSGDDSIHSVDMLGIALAVGTGGVGGIVEGGVADLAETLALRAAEGVEEGSFLSRSISQSSRPG